jgi:hypothetical protein
MGEEGSAAGDCSNFARGAGGPTLNLAAIEDFEGPSGVPVNNLWTKIHQLFRVLLRFNECQRDPLAVDQRKPHEINNLQ